LPVIEPHPIVVFAGGASHSIAFTRHYAPNLTVSAKAISRLWIDSWIAVGYDHVRRISVRETTPAKGFTSTRWA
jgi:hypothetical protein